MKETVKAQVIVTPINRIIRVGGLLGGMYVGKKAHEMLAVNGISGAKNIAASIAAGYATAAVTAGIAEMVSPSRTEINVEENC